MFQKLGSDDVLEQWEGPGPVMLLLVEIQAPGLHAWRVEWRMARTGGQSFDTEQAARVYLAGQLAENPGLQRVV